MQQLKVPPQWQEEIDLASLKCRSKPFSDKEGFQSICNRCMNANTLINWSGDHCTGCGQEFIRNFLGFDSLPLVEFVPQAHITHQKTIEYLRMDPPDDGTNFAGFKNGKKGGKGGNGGWQETGTGNEDEQTMVFTNNQEDDMDNDLFTQKMLEQLETQLSPESNKPVEVDERVLQHLRFEEVFVVDYTRYCKQLPRKYYKNMLPDVSITMCECCCKFFIQDEYEFAYIEKGHCPFCKHIVKDKGVKNVYGSLADMRN
mmetsp:Transcript_17875/g.30373  ORF Transcript_17875/g.30373 Transcript_17875/m.30373 type:complete len:257 (-) Transcript_17875:23-793(-)